MNQQPASGHVEIPDDLLSDGAALSAHLLRSLAERWRFRLRAGRPARGWDARVLRFVKKRAAPARTIERADPGAERINGSRAQEAGIR